MQLVEYDALVTAFIFEGGQDSQNSGEVGPYPAVSLNIPVDGQYHTTENIVSSFGFVIDPDDPLPSPAIYPPDFLHGAAGVVSQVDGSQSLSTTAQTGIWYDAGTREAGTADAFGSYVFDDDDANPNVLEVRIEVKADVGTEIDTGGAGFEALFKYGYAGRGQFRQFRNGTMIEDVWLQMRTDESHLSIEPPAHFELEYKLGLNVDPVFVDDYGPIVSETGETAARYKFWIQVQDGDILEFDSVDWGGLPSLSGGSGIHVTFEGDPVDGTAEIFWSGSAGAVGRLLPDGISIPPDPDPMDPIDTTPPKVMNVAIGNSSSMYSFATHVGSGDQLTPVPVPSADTITIEFDEVVYLLPQDLQLVGLVSGDAPVIEDFVLDGNTATWVFSEPFGPDQYRLVLDDFVSDASLNWLDGEWDNPVSLSDSTSSTFDSGDDVAGGDFVFDFATALVVTTNQDQDQLLTDPSFADQLSLREALAVAAVLPGRDSIVFAPDVDYITLSEGELVIGSDLDILGPGAQDLTIEADESHRVFSVVPSSVEATITGVTITGGAGVTTGGGIYNRGDLTLVESRITGNSATFGGGVYSSGNLHLIASEVSDNTATGDGGGVFLFRGTRSVGAEIVNSTLSGNEAGSLGGAIYSVLDTDSGVASDIIITNSTITDNEASSGGGLYQEMNDFQTTLYMGTLRNTIVAENRNHSDSPSDIAGYSLNPASSGNLLGQGGSGGLLASTNVILTGTETAGLSDLMIWGGQTRTHALIEGSKAIDAGNNDFVDSSMGDLIPYDQRGPGYDRIVDGGIGYLVDIGAYESGNMSFLAVSAAEGDVTDGIYVDGEMSLREALEMAAETPGPETIYFDPITTPSIIRLTQGQLLIDSDVSIVGPGADMMTIDADENSRGFKVNSGVEATIRGLTVTGGDVTGAHGGGIYSSGTLTLDGVVISDNYSNQAGGGIYNNGGNLTLLGSTVEANVAAKGGGIFDYGDGSSSLQIVNSALLENEAFWSSYNGSGRGGGLFIFSFSTPYATASFVNTTFSGNVAGIGGGVFVNGYPTVEFINSTITDNNGTQQAGGIFNTKAAATVTLHNSIIAANKAGAAGLAGYTANFDGTFDASSSHNLVGTGYNGGLSASLGNLLNIASPGLAPLANYGGATNTHALLSTSPAIDAGSNDVVDTYFANLDLLDQRGLDRIVDWELDDAEAVVDIGAVELAFDETHT